MGFKLGEYFSGNLKEQLALDIFKEGCVLKIMDHVTPPKEKRFIVIAFDINKISISTLYINSEINPNIFKTEEQIGWHIKLKAEENRSYLSHDSFVDCSHIIEQEAETIKNALKIDPTIHLGQLSEDDIKLIKNSVRECRNISTKVKKDYGFIY